MKFVWLFLVAALPAFGKGFLASGKFVGQDSRGQAVSITLEVKDGSMTVVAECDFDYYCTNTPRVNGYLNMYAYNETYDLDHHGSWGVTYGVLGPRRVFYPLFTLTIPEPEASTMTLQHGAETIALTRRP